MTIWLETSIMAPYPIAVEYSIVGLGFETSVVAPKYVLLFPVTSEYPDL